MYSMILMAAMATGGDAANCHFFCGAGCGCYGGCFGSCYGCCGCYGGWYSGACYGSCYGGYGCCGGYYYGGCCGGCYGCCGGYANCSGCYGCGGYAPVYSGYAPSTAVPQGMPMMPPAKTDTLPEPKATTPGASAASRARLIVELPADAKLFIDDHLMRTTSDRRTFNTPTLEDGQTYYYELRAEVVRDGKPVVVSRRITLKAGDEIQTNFGDMESTATVSTVKAR